MDLLKYCRYFIKQKLHDSYSLDDCVSEAICEIMTKPKLSLQLRQYFVTNTIPKGKDLSFLKAILYRQRLKFIKKEKRFISVKLTENYQEEQYDG